MYIFRNGLSHSSQVLPVLLGMSVNKYVMKYAFMISHDDFALFQKLGTLTEKSIFQKREKLLSFCMRRVHPLVCTLSTVLFTITFHDCFVRKSPSHKKIITDS